MHIFAVSGDDWGGIVNGTGNGMIGALYDRKVDVAIGCLYSWYTGVFDTSFAVAKSAITLLVPSAL